MKDIRTLTVEKIRAYHKEYYRPDNMCVCITGKVSAEQIFASIAEMEDKFAERADPARRFRPFLPTAHTKGFEAAGFEGNQRSCRNVAS
ncbi:hypothetical protein T484DRAFT_1762020 [Baffinella frigidus]|nr:hypothetical protein T484DRAFT_1762020 [Cryptophyta sp. CCMP2293]